MDESWSQGDDRGDPEDIHQRGAHQFGTLWLAVNQAIVDTCSHQGIEVWTEPWRTVLPKIAWKWCEDVVRAEGRTPREG